MIQSSQLDVHFGNILMHIASMYETVLKVLLEQVQNALDVDAKYVEIVVNAQSGVITVRDNGTGVSVDMFDRALLQIGQTLKTNDKLGRFGLGVMSPLGKCHRWAFTSCPYPTQNAYREWTFVTKFLQDSERRPEIQSIGKTSLRFGEAASGVAATWWRTQVQMFDVTTDKVLSRVTMDEIVDAITSRFNVPMRRLGTRVSVTLTDAGGNTKHRKFTATDFTGEALEEVELVGDKCKKTVFQMYLVKRGPLRKGGRRASEKGVCLGEMGNDFRIPFASFAKSVGSDLSSEAVDALRSGIFEGQILCEGVTLTAKRTTFEENEARLELCMLIDEWFQKVGKPYTDEVRRLQQSERYQRVGIRTMQRLKELLKGSRFQEFCRVLKGFECGTVGFGHKRPDPEDLEGQQGQRSLSTEGGPFVHKQRRDEKHRARAEPQQDKRGHKPATVAGPRGNQREVVAGDSQGLQIVHGLLMDAKMWELDKEHGVLTINTRHTNFRACDDRSEAALEQYEMHIVLSALTLETMPAEWQEHIQTAFEDYTMPFVAHLVTPFERKPKEKPVLSKR